jgi:hypothetical protein
MFSFLGYTGMGKSRFTVVHMENNTLILSNKKVICKLTVTPTQDGCPHVVNDDCPHMDTRWPPQDGQQGRAVRGDHACRGEQLEETRPAGESS